MYRCTIKGVSNYSSGEYKNKLTADFFALKPERPARQDKKRNVQSKEVGKRKE
jgi:hypothetical protein